MLWRFSQHFFSTEGERALARGDAANAISLAEECLALAEPSGSKKYCVKARRLKGLALLHEGDVPGAQREIAAALEMAQSLANPPQLWKSSAAMGDVLAAANRRSEAEAAYRQAMAAIESACRAIHDPSIENAFLASREVGAIRGKLD